MKVIDKTPARTTKRNAPAEAPVKVGGAEQSRGGRRGGGYAGNEGGEWTQISVCGRQMHGYKSYG